MRVLGHMFAFCDGSQAPREIDIPDEECSTLLSILIGSFKYGQNDFQPRRCPSMSAGDVVEITEGQHKGFYLTCMVGFDKLTPERYEKLRAARPTGSFTDPTEGSL